MTVLDKIPYPSYLVDGIVNRNCLTEVIDKRLLTGSRVAATHNFLHWKYMPRPAYIPEHAIVKVKINVHLS